MKCGKHYGAIAFRAHTEPCHDNECDGFMHPSIFFAPDVGLHWIECNTCGLECFNQTVNWPGNR